MIAFELNDYKLARVDELRLPLVNRFYSECKYNVKCGRDDLVYSLKIERKIVAAARLIPQASGSYLLRNLCVLPEYRNQGIAPYLVTHILKDLAPQPCYCYALPHLKNFYIALHFTELAVEQVPQEIGRAHV